MISSYQVNSIPLYTNKPSIPYGWFIIYNNHNFMYEYTNYAHMQYKDMAKSNIDLFGLYGNNFKFISDFTDGSMYIYWRNKLLTTFNFLLSNQSIEQKISSHVYHCRPFYLKSFIYDFNVSNPIKSDTLTTDKYYSGYNGLILSNNYPFKINQYFSIDVINHPNTIAIITKLQKIDNIDYPKTDYIFSVYKNHKISNDNNLFSLSNSSIFKHKTIYTF